MSDVGIIAGYAGLPSTGGSVAASTTTESSASSEAFSVTSTTATTASSASSSATKAAAAVASPQVMMDPTVGLVMQYLGLDGSVVSQVPSTLALTYLRAGLTADGLSRQSEIGSSSVFA